MLKKVITTACFSLAVVAVCAGFVRFAKEDTPPAASLENKVYAAQENAQDSQKTVLELSIGSQILTVNGDEQTIDEQSTVPIVENGRTLLPVRAIIEAVGGSIEWNAEEKASTITYNDDTVKLVIDSETAYKNSEEKKLDAAPIIVNGRTMLPIRFIAESFGFDVDWNEETKTVTVTAETNAPADTSNIKTSDETLQTAGTAVALSSLEHLSSDNSAPVVYFTKDITSDGLIEIYEKLNWNPTGKVAVKVSTGEPPASNYLRTELIGDLVKQLDGTIVECMTAYGGSRAEVEMHKQVAKDHGFTDIADFDLMDEEGETELPVVGGTRLTKNIVGSHIDNYGNYLVLSHFKGHAMAGFGGAIKNVAIGMSSKHGKVNVHTAGERIEGSIFYDDQDAWLEALSEAVKSVSDHMNNGENIIYISVMNRLSVDCDCDGNPAEPDMHDIGILASTDPVALDQACVDLIYAVPDGGALIERMESRHGIHTLEHAEEIGLGSRTYKLVNID